MKILSCVSYGYYQHEQAAAYEYVSFVTVLREMGHEVHHLDMFRWFRISEEAANEFFLSLARTGGYDLIFVMTIEQCFAPEVLDEAKAHSVTLAFNCDDDWRWEELSEPRAPHFTFMATTYRHVYEAHRERHPNLILSQWGCTGHSDGAGVEKDMDVSFVGAGYGRRNEQLAHLRKQVEVTAYGRGVPARGGPWHRSIRRGVARILRIPWHLDGMVLPDQAAVKDVWNRSRISFTPLDAGPGESLQIKGRVFDMGLSGTLMLCHRNEALEEWYRPGEEYVDFDDINECAEKARYYLKNESERARIAAAYRERTLAEHMWPHRFEAMFRDMGLA